VVNPNLREPESNPHPLISLADRYQANGWTLVMLGLVASPALLLISHHQLGQWWGMILIALLLIAVFSLLNGNEKWLAKTTAHLKPAPADMQLIPNPWRMPDAAIYISEVIVVSVILVLLAHLGILSLGFIWLVSGEMISVGILQVIRANHIRQWEQSHAAKLLAPTTWHINSRLDCFIGSAAPSSSPSTPTPANSPPLPPA
jgi:hypothetical protein